MTTPARAGGAGADDGDPSNCDTPFVADTPLRRLSSDEYDNTLRALLGEGVDWRILGESRFPQTTVTNGFTTDAEANIVNTTESNAIEDNAERIARIMDEDPERYIRSLTPRSCTFSESIREVEIDECIDAFIEEFGTRVTRRPMTPAESAIAKNLYDAVRADSEASYAFNAVVQYFIQSPALLYRTERGGERITDEVVALTSFERATRLSYFLTASTPDEELLRAAAADELRTVDQVRAQAMRLLNSEQFLSAAERFHRDWLEMHGFDYKETDAFPGFDPARASLEREQGMLLRHVLNEGDGSIASLLGTDTYLVNATLAAYYGVDAETNDDDTWVPVVIPNRRGLLTQASLMATLASPTSTDPIHRGGFIRTQILCQPLPALPANLDLQAPLQDTSTLPTARERLSPLMTNGDCAGCHQLINPLGLAFESYDAAGQHRRAENGTAIDASGTVALDGEMVAFDGPEQLVDALARSQAVSECYAEQWYRAALGRPEFQEDACGLERVHQATMDSGGDIRTLLLSLVETDAFLHIRKAAP